jgi:hypothetical protein
VRQSRPLNLAESIRYPGRRIRRAVDHNREQEGDVLRHVGGTIHGQFPFPTEVPFPTSVRVSGNDRNEERAIVNLLSNLMVPSIATAQLALIKPNLYSRGA